ncbi:MAG: thioredoxin family protein [Methanothrix sp.]
MFHFHACTYCQEIMPYFEEYARKFRGRAKFVRINTLESSFIPERYGVMATPTFKLFCGGRPIQEMVGAVQPFLLKRMVEEGISTGVEWRRRSTPIDYNIGYP